MPPGAAGWHLPSPAMPMIWEGLTDHQLCELFKDPRQNGHRTVEQIVEHMHTPLVLWGWAPGDGRTPVPTLRHEFLAKIQEWVEKGQLVPWTQAPQHRCLSVARRSPVLKQKQSSRRRRNSIKSILRLPDLEHAKTAALNSLNSADARRGYRHAIDDS